MWIFRKYLITSKVTKFFIGQPSLVTRKLTTLGIIVKVLLMPE